MATFRGTGGDDTLTGTSGNDNFLLWQGGSDTVDGGGGNDIFHMGAALDAGDKLDGGTGKDVISLNGDYSAGLVFNADTITNIEVMGLAGGHSYNLTLNDGNVAAGDRLLVKAQTLGASDHLTFDGSAELDGKFYIIAGAGNDTITGGARHDVFDLSHGGSDTAHGGGGNDTFNMGAAFDSGDQIDGGAGTNTLNLDGIYGGEITVSGAMVQNIQTVNLLGDHFYSVTFAGSLSGGAALTVDASALGAGHYTNLDFSLSDAPGFTVTGSAGDDTITFAANFSGSDAIDGGVGNDTLKLNGDYSAGVTLGASTMTNFENLLLGAGHDYNITFDDGNIAAGIALSVDTTALSGHTFTLDDAAETDGTMVVTAGAAFTAADSFIGGTASTASAALLLDGDYSGGLVFGATTAQNLTDIELAGGHSYNLTLNAATPAAGALMALSGNALGAGDTLTVDGSAVTGANLNIYGGAGNDVITGGQDGDVIDISTGGNDTVHGGSGTDEFDVGGSLTAADSIDGGGGGDVLSIAGDYTGANALVMGAATVTRVAEFRLGGGSSYDITTNDATVASGATMHVDGSVLGAGDTLTFNGAAETNGSFVITGGAGNDTITGGTLANTIAGGLGADTIVCGGGADTIFTNAVADSTGAGGYDTIDAFNFDTDTFNLIGAHTISEIDTNSAFVDSTTFDANLAAASAGHMAADGVLFIGVTSGDLAGHSFMVVDVNNDGLYQAGTDYVFDMVGATGTAGTGDFI